MDRFWKLGILCVAVVSLGIVLLGTGCGSSNNTRVRLLNAVPTQSGLDMLVASKSVATGVGYGTASAYTSVSSGSPNLQIEATGTTTALVNQSITLASKTDYTVLAMNSSSGVTAIVLTDNNATPASGQIEIRVINASPSLGASDVYVVAPGTSIASVTPTVAGVAVGSATAYQSVAAGSYEVFFAPAGQKFVSIDSGPLTFTAGQIRTVVGLDGQTGGFSSAVLADLN